MALITGGPDGALIPVLSAIGVDLPELSVRDATWQGTAHRCEKECDTLFVTWTFRQMPLETFLGTFGATGPRKQYSKRLEREIRRRAGEGEDFRMFQCSDSVALIRKRKSQIDPCVRVERVYFQLLKLDPFATGGGRGCCAPRRDQASAQGFCGRSSPPSSGFLARRNALQVKTALWPSASFQNRYDAPRSRSRSS